MTPNPKHSLGWIPDVPDNRDVPFASRYPSRKTLPRSIDLRADCSPVEQQGGLGSGTAFARVHRIGQLAGRGTAGAVVGTDRVLSGADGGGGGEPYDDYEVHGGSGGSGSVIVRYKIPGS